MPPTSPRQPPQEEKKASSQTLLQDTLQYGCICGDGKQPNVSEYTLTLPYHTCTEYGNQCVENCEEHDNECARACREDHPCGAQDPQGPSGTASAAAPTSTDDDDGDDDDEEFEPLGGEGAAGRVELGGTYGLFVVLGALFAGFGML